MLNTSQPTEVVSIHARIHHRALEISARYKRSEFELIEVLEQVDHHQVYLHRGHASLFQYGVKELELSESVIYNLIAVMRKAREVPSLKVEIQAGKITLSNAKRIAPILTLANQDEWLKKASELSQRQLEKEVVKIKPETAILERVKYISVSGDETRVKLELGLSEKDMMRLRRAQDLVSQSSSKHASLEETLIEMTAFYLKHRDPVIKAKRIFVKKGFVKKGFAKKKLWKINL